MRRGFFYNVDSFFRLMLVALCAAACQGEAGFQADADAGPGSANGESPEVGSANLRATSGELVTLDASNLLGLQGATYYWSQLSGPAVTLGAPSEQVQSFVAPTVDEVDFVLLGLDAIANEIAVKTVITITIVPAGTTVPPTCDDGVQNGDETGVDCGGSCPPCPPEEVCGDNTCSSGEDCSSCTWDCGVCQTCGDGTCDAGEDCASCASDCGTCQTPDVCGTLADACHSDPLGDSDYCSDACPCGYGEGDCDSDSDCQDGLECEHNIGADFGRDSGEDLCVLPGYPSNQDQCTSSPQPEPEPSCGDGTCDAGEDCASCASDCGICQTPDVCGTLADACHSDPLGDSDYCSDACPCGYGEGDCDSDSDCQDGLECEHNIGADFGRDSGEDLCVLPGYPSNQDQCTSPQPEPEPSCGDGTCDAGEDCASCASDCGTCQTPSSCGDGTCDANESCSSCSADCGACPAPSTSDIEGFGAQTLGADGCSNPQTYHVTTLSDSGDGSFRDAISQGCRHIVFDVGGTIVLRDDLSIEDSFITIDGSTAPAPGITFEHGADYKLTIKADEEDVHDIIARYLRSVGPGGHPDSSQDFWGFDAGGSGDIYNVVLEHLTLTGATDGIFDFNADETRNAYYNITLAYNFIHTQYRAASIRGPKNITVHHNVWARVDDRGPKYSDQAEAHHINNVHYQWGYICHRNDPHGLSLDSDGIVDPKVLAEYNYLQPADTPSCGRNADDAIYYRTGVGGSQLFLRENHLPPEENDTSSVSSPPISVPSWAAVTVTPVNQLGDALVPCAGTHYPTQAERDLLREVSLAVGGQGGACQ